MPTQNNLALEKVAETAQLLLQAEAQVKAEAEAWKIKQLEPINDELERAVLNALDEGYSVTDVARAYTVSGKTANRNAIYAIRDAHAGEDRTADLPFEWKARELTTVRGTTTVFDVYAELTEFGPEAFSGSYVWRYDAANERLEQVLDPVVDPYPEDQGYYGSVLQRWLENNPYPGES